MCTSGGGGGPDGTDFAVWVLRGPKLDLACDCGVPWFCSLLLPFCPLALPMLFRFQVVVLIVPWVSFFFRLAPSVLALRQEGSIGVAPVTYRYILDGLGRRTATCFVWSATILHLPSNQSKSLLPKALGPPSAVAYSGTWRP